MIGWLKTALGAAPERKDLSARTLIALQASTRPAWGPRSYAQFALEGYAKNPVVFRCVRLIAESAASVRFTPRRYGRELEPGDPVVELLDRPNPEQSATELFESFYGFLGVAGNAYVEAADVDGAPRALFVLRPDRMSVLPGDRGWPAGWEYVVERRKTRFLRDAVSGRSPILHMKVFNPGDDHYGLSPMEAAAFAVDTHTAGGAWNKALLDNAARPSGALVYSGEERLTEEQFERLKAELSESHQGPRSAGKPPLLEGGLDWKPFGPRDPLRRSRDPGARRGARDPLGQPRSGELPHHGREARACGPGAEARVVKDEGEGMRLDLKISMAVILAIVLETAGALLWAGAAAERIDHLEVQVGQSGLANERLARLEAQAVAMRTQLDRIEARLDQR